MQTINKILLFITLSVALVLVTQPSTVFARRRASGKGAISNSPNEFSFHFGGQASARGWTPGGAKLFFEYGRDLGSDLWLNLQFNLVFGDRWRDRHCWLDDEDRLVCTNEGYRGSAGELVGGVKWKFFPFSFPFMLYAKAGGQLVMLSYPYSTWGIALAARGGGGFKFFIVDNFGIGMEANMSLGFVHLEHWGLDLYSSFDIGFGLEVLF